MSDIRKWKALIESASKIVENDTEDMAHTDHEVSMAKSQLLSAVKSATRIAKQLQDKSEEEGLEGWVASKLTMAEDYLQAVADHMDGQEINEGYKVMPPMDPKYVERSGLEGPFTTLSGKVVYYDSKEGKYYDPDTDIYLSYDEFQNYDKDYSGMKDERDEVKEAGGYYTQPVYDMIKQHGYPKVMHKLLTSLDADVIQSFLQRADLDESGLRPSFAQKIRNAELNKGKGAPKSGKTTGPDDYDFLKYKNKKKETNEDSSGALDQDMWDTIKRGDKITIGYDSAIKKDNMQTFVVRSKNVVGKAKVGKITMTTEAGKGKYFLYNRNGKISLALGDMAASMTSAMVESTEMMTEAQFDEAAGEKDACYRKVKSRYKVWPSAYASGALVKCRKVGASNWGNSKK